MNVRKLVLPSLAVGAALTLALRLAARTTAEERAAADEPYAEIDAYLEREMRHINLPGAALAIVKDDEIVHVRGLGRARPGGEAPSPQTPFVIGSLTKSITALAVMQCVEEGRVELDAPVRKYLPWFRTADPEASAQITVRHLLNQTSALPQMPGIVNLTNFDASSDAAEKQARALAALKLTRPVGSSFEYSNLNYNLLGLIVEAVSGESYADYVQAHIFAPLEMDHSYTSQAEARQNCLAVGHRHWFGFPFPMPNLPLPRGSLPSGQLISSAEDVGHYLIAHLNAGRYRDARILSEAGVEELHRPEAPVSMMGKSMGHYGMGWFTEDSGDARIVWHSGTLPDFFAFTAMVPEQKTALVLLVNTNHMLMDKLVLVEVGMHAARQLAGERPAPPRTGTLSWILRALLLIPALQLADAGNTLRRQRRWRQEPGGPRGERTWAAHLLPPALLNLLAAVPLLGLLGTGTLRTALFFMPDFAWLSLFSGIFALIWTPLRAWLAIATLRRSQDPEAGTS